MCPPLDPPLNVCVCVCVCVVGDTHCKSLAINAVNASESWIFGVYSEILL